MQRLSFCFFLLFVYLFALIPFWLLYFFSFVLYAIAFYVIKYRRKVVYSNLQKVFPEKSEVELRKLEKKFYKHLANIMVESLKGFTMKPADIVARHKVVNLNILDPYINAGQTVVMAGGHYGNWEWGSMSGGLQAKCPLVIFYKPLSNKVIDNFLVKTRARCGTIMASIAKTYHAFQQQASTPSLFLLIADQSPSRLDKAYWINFLGIETAFLHGPEQYSRKFNYPFYFVDIKKVKRGYYELELVKITDNPSSMPEGEITAVYAQMLEGRIRKEPEYWLWSHRRWKHTRKQ